MEPTAKHIMIAPFWHGETDQFKRTVPLDTANCFTLPLAPGFTAFHDYCKRNKIDPSATFKASECCMPTYQVQPAVTVSEGATKTAASEGAYSDPKLVNLNGEDQSATTTELTLESPKKEDSAKLLRYHFKYGHVPFRRLQEMAQQGTIPPRLGKCPIPPCATCMFGKAHRQPKQSKSKKTITDPEEVKAPRDLVSVDVLVSSTPGLVAQMAGFLTRKWYKYACVFVDHFSDFGYVYMMKEHTANEALDAKLAFDAAANIFCCFFKPVVCCHLDFVLMARLLFWMSPQNKLMYRNNKL
jgi:hypothetical protein